MNKLLSMMLKQVHSMGMSTANSISRVCIYEPEEDIILSEMISKRQNKADAE